MAKKLISYDDEATGLGLPDVVEEGLNANYALKGEVPTGVVKSVNGEEPDDTGALTITTGNPDAVTSPAIKRFLTSQDPNYPLVDGDFLFVYEAALTDFTHLTTMDGFTKRFNDTAAWALVDDATAADGKVFQLTGAQDRRSLSWDITPVGEADIELVTRVKVGSVHSSIGGGLIIRGSGTGGAETGYLAGLLTGRLQLGVFNNGAYSSITTSDFEYVADQWYWIRFRAQGEQLSVKVWVDGETEPQAWAIERSSDTITDAGWAGLYGSGPITQTWDVLGIAADGGTAPKEA